MNFPRAAEKKRVIILGGGITGLSAAHKLIELSRAGEESTFHPEILLAEASGRLGGLIRTRREQGFLIESGPDSMISENPWAIDLSRRLGLENQMIPTQEKFRRSFIWRAKKLRPVPAGFYLMAAPKIETLLGLPFMSLPGKCRMALEPLIRKKSCAGDESVGSFIRRRFGSEALSAIGQPMIGGIYMADPERLSLAATLPQFLEMERRHGSVIRGLKERAAKSAERAGQMAGGPRYSLFMSFRDGMQTLVDALERALTGSLDVRIHSRPMTLDRAGSGWEIRFEKEKIFADGVLVCLPAREAARLLKTSAPEVSKPLAQVRYESVISLALGFKREDVGHPLDGFGIVIPSKEGFQTAACTLSSVKYPGRAPQGRVLLRAFLGGAFNREVLEKSDDEILRTVRSELRQMLGITGDPVLEHLERYPDSMPQYEVGHLQRMDKMEKALEAYPGLALAGNAYRGVGIPDAVRSGEEAAERIYAFLNSPKESVRHGV